MLINETGKVGFVQACKDYWRGYVNFSGKTTRAGYWWAQLMIALIAFAIALVVGVICAMVSAMYATEDTEIIFVSFGFIAYVCVAIILLMATYLANLALITRRMNDLGLPFWLSLLLAIIGGSVTWILAFFPTGTFAEKEQNVEPTKLIEE